MNLGLSVGLFRRGLAYVIDMDDAGHRWIARCPLEQALPYLARVLRNLAAQRDDVLRYLSEELNGVEVLRFAASLDSKAQSPLQTSQITASSVTTPSPEANGVPQCRQTLAADPAPSSGPFSPRRRDSCQARLSSAVKSVRQSSQNGLSGTLRESVKCKPGRGSANRSKRT
jgi:hypothetical protein